MTKSIVPQPFEYRVQEFLGEGLNSCVYRAIKECPTLGVRFEVALKVLKSENLVALWRNEFERLSSIRSIHCVQLLGWEVLHNAPTLVLEFVDGTTLGRMIQVNSLNSRQVIEILNQAYQGVLDLAKAGVFHGDLNLHNIMIDKNGVVRLVDFGIYGANGDVYATPEFAAPEILMGGSPNLSTDILSLQLVGEKICRDQGTEMKWTPHSHGVDMVARSEIALLVEVVQAQDKSKEGLTQKLASIYKNQTPIYKGLFSFALILALIAPFLASGDQGRRTSKGIPVKISVRTTKWLRIGLYRDQLKYSPLDLVIDNSKNVKLYYQNQQTESVISLTLKPGQHIVLSDDFFANRTLGDGGSNNDRKKTQLTQRARK